MLSLKISDDANVDVTAGSQSVSAAVADLADNFNKNRWFNHVETEHVNVCHNFAVKKKKNRNINLLINEQKKELVWKIMEQVGKLPKFTYILNELELASKILQHWYYWFHKFCSHPTYKPFEVLTFHNSITFLWEIFFYIFKKII